MLNFFILGIGLKSAFYRKKKKEKIEKRLKEYQSKSEDLLSELKKKHWCKFCMKEAKFHCCWNVSYCSYKCQVSNFVFSYLFEQNERNILFLFVCF